jgi:hypothetical protein
LDDYRNRLMQVSRAKSQEQQDEWNKNSAALAR